MSERAKAVSVLTMSTLALAQERGAPMLRTVIERGAAASPPPGPPAPLRRSESGSAASLLARLLPAALVVLAAACEPTNQGYAPEQPIKYSHAVHAGGLQIPCQYCHYAAERGRYAGIPPAATCMNCHKQVLPEHPEVKKVKAALETGKPIQWVRIHQLPDHAYFNHRAHVKAGVVCQSCHGPVEQMGRVEQFASLTMGWCVACHRQGSDRSGTLLSSVGAARANRLTDCGVCHH